MRADRLLNILLIMQEHTRITATELAHQLEVSPRTVHRDMEALSMAGIPVYAERGRDGGYALLDSFRSELHHLTSPELRALFIHSPAILRDLGLRQAAESAQRKLKHALPAQGRDAAHLRRHILIDGAGWRQSAEDHPYLTVVHDAIWQGRQARITYRRADGETRIRNVHPLGLVAKGRLWYLVAGINETETDKTEIKGNATNGVSTGELSLRTYRISRIEDAGILDQPAYIPPDFDLASYWEASAAHFVATLPRYNVQIWASPRAVNRLPSAGWFVQIEHKGETRADRWQHLHLAFHTPETAISCLAGFGDDIEIVEPAEVSAGVIALAQAILRQAAHKSA